MTDHHHPLDPNCPVVAPLLKLREEPTVRIGKLVWAEMEYEHRKSCERCQRYGMANIEVTDS